jgi:C-terminal processing protease CtpA/Prc
VLGTRENSPAAQEGLKPGDLITEIDATSTKNLSISEAIGRLRGPANTQVRLTVIRDGVNDPINIAVTRGQIYLPAVEVVIRSDGTKLLAEASGQWPVLDFEKGKPVELTAVIDDEFYVDNSEHTRITFVRDGSGKVSGAILDSGSPMELRGTKRSS